MAKKKKYYVRPDGLHETIKVINGKRVAFRGKTDAEVDRKMIEYVEKQNQGRSFLEVAEEWHDKHIENLAISTEYGYRKNYARACDKFGKYPVKDITPKMIKSAIDELGRQYAKKTVANFKSVLKMIFDYALFNNEILSNPCLAIRLPNGLKETPRELPPDNEITKIKNTDTNGIGLLPYLILFTGCRRGEALALTWNDVDFKNNTISICKSLTFQNNKPIVKTPKTKKGFRTVPLLEPLKKKLLPMIPTDRSRPIIEKVTGGYHDNSSSRKAYDRWQKENGITSTLHQLRHGYTTMAVEAGLDVKTVQELLGHAQISTTLDIYTHIRQRRLDEAAKTLNNYANSFGE